jgi:hypothetical protein
LESLHIPKDDLYFSFDKDNFSNFEFNLNYELLNDKSLTNPPFGFSTPLGNFVNAFSLIYQHSLVKNDEKFKEILEKLFKYCYEKNVECDDRVLFEDYLTQQETRIKKILEEKGTCQQLVLVEETNGKIVCKVNNLFATIHTEADTCVKLTPEEAIMKEKVNFFLKFNEMFLQGKLGTGFLSSFNKLNEEYEENKECNESDHPHEELLPLYSKIDHLLRSQNEKLADETEENCRKFCKEELTKAVNRYSNLIIQRRFNAGEPKYFDELIAKVTAKVLYNVSDNLEIFSLYPDEYTESVIALKEHLIKHFEEKKLLKNTVESLVILCLELDI